MKLIDSEELINKINARMITTPDVTMVRKLINECYHYPIIQPKTVKEGRWIDWKANDPEYCRDDGKSVFMMCSECGTLEVRNLRDGANYCPRCGADMRDGKDGRQDKDNS